MSNNFVGQLLVVIGYLFALVKPHADSVLACFAPMTYTESVNDLRRRAKFLAQLTVQVEALNEIVKAEDAAIKAEWEALGASEAVHPLIGIRKRWTYKTETVEALALETGHASLLNRLDKPAFNLLLEAGKCEWAAPANPQQVADVIWLRDWKTKAADVPMLDEPEIEPEPVESTVAVEPGGPTEPIPF